jgi:uncharacterized protein YbjT (DUF2867 family)
MPSRILILGGTGMLGRPVVDCLTNNGHKVRILTRTVEKTQNMFGDTVEIAEGSAINNDDIRAALAGIDAVHINLSPETEYAAMQHVIDLAEGQLARISYVSATTLSEENRWFERVDVKMRTEELLRKSGIQHVIFCPTWVMETLQNFINGSWAVVVLGNNPPALHFFAAADFGRMVAASYEDQRGFGKRLYVYGPEAITLAEAMERFAASCHPEARVMRWKLWQARLAAKLLRNKSLAEVTELIAYLDEAGEHGDPSEANTLYGAPAITLDEWCRMPKDSQAGWPH